MALALAASMGPGGWSTIGSTLPSVLCLHLPNAGLPSPLEAGLVQPGMERGRLGGHGELRQVCKPYHHEKGESNLSM